MTSNPSDSGDHRPDLTKRPGDADATTEYHTPTNPYPPQSAYAAPPSDQFVPYTPPAYSDPLQTGYPTPHYPAPHYSAPHYSAPQYPVPGFPMTDTSLGQPQPGAVNTTRALGAAALVAATLLIAYGWLTWASFEPKYGDSGRVTVDGWGQAFRGDLEIVMYPGAAGMPFTAFFIPLFVLPVLVLGLLVLCNIGRFGNSIAILVLACVHLFLAFAFVVVPSTCVIFDDRFDATTFEETNNFSTGPGAILTMLTLLVVVGTSIAGIILGRKKIYPTPVATPGQGGYPTY